MSATQEFRRPALQPPGPRATPGPPRPRHRAPLSGRLLAISQEMRRSRPVLIVGEARSGSTLLYHTLGKHPTFAPRRENLQESSFIVQAAHAAGFRDDPPRNLRRYLLEDEQVWERFLASIRPLRPWLRATERLPAADAWRLGPARLVARSFAFHAREARGCERLLEKTPDHVHHIDRIVAAFPRARLLYVHRHPVDVYSSYVRRGQVDPKADWARIGPEEFCDRYRERTRAALAAADRHDGALLLVRYESLTSRPQTELARICDFLDEPCDLGALLRADHAPGRVAHWEASSHLFEGIKTETKRWQDYCTDAEAGFIQDQLGPEMRRLRYDRYGT